MQLLFQQLQGCKLLVVFNGLRLINHFSKDRESCQIQASRRQKRRLLLPFSCKLLILIENKLS